MPLKTVKVEGEQVDGYKFETKTRGHVLLVDQPVEGGGKDTGPTPLEYLLISLAGCLGSVGYIIVRQRRLPVEKIRVSIEGDIDTDVLLGKKTDVRAGFTDIRVKFMVDGEMSHSEKEAFLHDIDLRCPISDNILNISKIDFIVE